VPNSGVVGDWEPGQDDVGSTHADWSSLVGGLDPLAAISEKPVWAPERP
jgi:hypothetical protein